MAANSTDDTYRGFNTSPARQAEIFGTGTYNDPYETGTGADPNIGFVSGVTGDAEFTGAPSVASAALASLDDSFNLSPAASPSQNLTAEQKAIVETALSRGEQPPDFSKPMTVAELAREKELEDIFSETNLDPAAGQEEQRARNEQQMADRAVALNAINDMLGISRAQDATAQDVLGGGISTITGHPVSRPQVRDHRLKCPTRYMTQTWGWSALEPRLLLEICTAVMRTTQRMMRTFLAHLAMLAALQD